MRALIAEDHPSLRSLYNKWLNDFFEEIDLASDGSQAISFFLQSLMGGKPYSFVMLDIMLPEMYGYDVLKEFRNLEKEYLIGESHKSKIVVITGLKQKKFMHKIAVEFGDLFLEKPVEKKDLINFINKRLFCS